MDILSKNRIMTFAVIALFLINTVLLILLWTSRPQQDNSDRNIHPPREKGPGAFIIKELEFDEVQQKKFEELRNAHRSEADKLQSEMRQLRDRLFNFSSGDSAKTDITSQIGQKQAQLETLTYDHFKSVRDLCSDQQKKKFDSIIGDVLKEMGKRPPPPPGK